MCQGKDPADASLFRAKINSDYNDFVARVALEVVDSSWWKQQLRVKSAGSGTTALSWNEGASRLRKALFQLSFRCSRFSLLQCIDTLRAARFAGNASKVSQNAAVTAKSSPVAN
jgi:hypothetical protein